MTKLKYPNFFRDEKLKKLIKLIKDDIKGTAFDGHVYVVGSAVYKTMMQIPLGGSDVDLVVDIKCGGSSLAGYLTVRNSSYIIGKNPCIYNGYGTSKFQLLSNDELKDIKIECSQTIKSMVRGTNVAPSQMFGSVEEDANRRDLTINALYYNITTEELCDFSTSLEDLAAHTLRTSGNADYVFSEDPLRILRVIRVATKLGWGIEKNTWLSMIANAYRIKDIAQERVTSEITKILTCDNPSIGIRKMYNCGILHRVLPNIYDLTTTYESKTPLITTFEHTMDVLDAMPNTIENRLAALFHDVGKIVTEKRNDFNLDKFSSEVASDDLEDMGYSSKIINSVETAIKYHRAFGMYKEGALPQDKKIRKFVNLVGSDLAVTFELMNANNNHSVYGKKPMQVINILNRIKQLQEEEKAANVEMPINGKDIMEKFKLKKGPIIGILLNEVKEAYFENPNITREDAMELVGAKIKSLTA